MDGGRLPHSFFCFDEDRAAVLNRWCILCRDTRRSWLLTLCPLGFPLLDKLFRPPDCPAGPARGGVLNLVAAVLPLLAPLGSVPQLGAQTFCAVLQAPAGQLLWRG